MELARDCEVCGLAKEPRAWLCSIINIIITSTSILQAGRRSIGGDLEQVAGALAVVGRNNGCVDLQKVVGVQ